MKGKRSTMAEGSLDAGLFDVVGIGNAIVDVLAHAEEGFLAQHGLNKGTMTLIDAERATALYGAMGPGIEVSGGSAANTIAGLASLGSRAGYIGKLGADELGRIFRHDIRANGVAFETPATIQPPRYQNRTARITKARRAPARLFQTTRRIRGSSNWLRDRTRAESMGGRLAAGGHYPTRRWPSKRSAAWA